MVPHELTRVVVGESKSLTGVHHGSGRAHGHAGCDRPLFQKMEITGPERKTRSR